MSFRLKNLLFVLFFACLISPTTTSAQTHCLKYPSNSAAPTNYGASWDVTSTLKELLVKSNCPTSGSSLDITIGKGSTSQYIWSTTYVYGGSSWTSYTLTGTEAGEGWLIGQGDKTITTPFTPTPANPLFFVGYVCTPSGSSWKCGCANTSCTTKHWQLQAYMGVSGGGTGGGGSVCTGDDCYPWTPANTPGGPVNIPSAQDEKEVSTADELSDAVATANPGDHIILKNGTYGGNYTISRSGNASNPIVVRAENTLGAQLPGSITAAGNYIVVQGLRMTGENSQIHLNGQYVRASRNSFNGSTVRRPISVGKHARYVRIDYNEIANYHQQGISLLSDPDGMPQYVWIHHNYIHHKGPVPDGVDTNIDEAIQMGEDLSNSHLNVYSVIEHNLVTDNTYCDDLISLKSSSNIVRLNTIMRIQGGLTMRNGKNNTIVSNFIREHGAGGIKVHDTDHTLIGNDVTGETIQVLADSDSFPKGEAARNILLAGNKGTLVIGHAPSSFTEPITPVRNIRVEAHTGTITKNKYEAATYTEVSTTSKTWPAPYQLTPSQVGPLAN